MTGETALQVPWLGVALRNVVPAGSVSVTITFVAGDGPAFDTVIVYVITFPATTDVVGVVLVIETSAAAGPATTPVALTPELPELPSFASLAALALKFVTQQPGITTALTSMHLPEYAAANIAAVDGPDLPAEVVDLLRTRHRFIKNFNNATHWD